MTEESKKEYNVTKDGEVYDGVKTSQVKWYKEKHDEIEAEYGTLICREMSQPFGEFDSKPRLKNCMEVIAFCARNVIKNAEIE
jgi:hypothetical protein